MSQHGAPYAAMALGITSQEWSQLSLGEDPNVAATSDMNVAVERITSLLLIRIVAWIQPRGIYSDLSTTSICRDHLIKQESWPTSITPDVITELRNYVKIIISTYQQVPYHNFEHAYHVIISTNKLLDMILHTQDIPKAERPTTFGLKDDPLMHFALIFSALIHDVEHQVRSSFFPKTLLPQSIWQERKDPILSRCCIAFPPKICPSITGTSKSATGE